MAREVVDLAFEGKKVGLVVRNKAGPFHVPAPLEQHADVILPYGAPMGFFGHDGGYGAHRYGMLMKGLVYDYDVYLKDERRKQYVDVNSAFSYGETCTVLVLDVTREEARKFEQFWTDLGKSPGTFNILGGNCSTHASACFIASGILKSGIPGLDTANTLYDQLRNTLRRAMTSYTGHIGFAPWDENPAKESSKVQRRFVVRIRLAQPAWSMPGPNL